MLLTHYGGTNQLTSLRFSRLVLLCAIGIWAVPVEAYNLEIHKDFYDFAFPIGTTSEQQLVPPDAGDLDSFRHFVFELAGDNPDFRARWPSSEDFTAYAMKEFLSLNPLRAVVGIDFVPPDREGDRRKVVREGSIDPDTDRRNQDRLHLLPDGTVALDALGRAVPLDPRTLWFGSLVGSASQFDAHGATLRHGSKGKFMLTTLGRSHQFARPKKIPLGSAPEFSAAYADLAMIARLWGGTGAEWLALTFAGNSLHGIEDMGNQIHATQIGSHRLYIDSLWAWIATRFKPISKKLPKHEAALFVPPERLTIEELKSALALLGTPELINPKTRYALKLEPTGNPNIVALTTDIIGSHHRLLEAYMQERYLETREAIRANTPERIKPEVASVIEAAEAGDASFRADAEAALEAAGLGQTPAGSTPFAMILAEQLLERSAPEAARVYNSIRAIAIRPLRRGRVVFHDGQPPMDFIKAKYTGDKESNKHTRRFWRLNAASFARVVSAVRIWFVAFDAETSGVIPGSPDATERAQRVALRLASSRLAAIKRADKRREEYLAQTK